MIKQEAMKPGENLNHGFLAFEFILCIAPGFMVSCSDFAFWSRTFAVQGF